MFNTSIGRSLTAYIPPLIIHCEGFSWVQDSKWVGRCIKCQISGGLLSLRRVVGGAEEGLREVNRMTASSSSMDQPKLISAGQWSFASVVAVEVSWMGIVIRTMDAKLQLLTCSQYQPQDD